VDCLLTAEWKSPNKVIARTGQAKGKGDIVVVTRSGGVGTSTVQFRGYNVQIGKFNVIAQMTSLYTVCIISGPLQESAVWIDETQTYHAMFSRNRTSSPVISDENEDPLGISDESNESVLNHFCTFVQSVFSITVKSFQKTNCKTCFLKVWNF
jgi:exocyst complex component 2